MTVLVEAAPACGWDVGSMVRQRAPAMLDGAVAAAERLYGLAASTRIQDWVMGTAANGAADSVACRMPRQHVRVALDVLGRTERGSMVEACLADARQVTTVDGLCS